MELTQTNKERLVELTNKAIDAFHKQFRLNGEPLEITPDDWTPDFVGETGIQRKKRIAYEKIVKYID